MYIPKAFAMTDVQQQHHVIEQYGFGVLINASLNATHLPFILDRKEGELGTLYTHIARANSHLETINRSRQLILFQGPHSYISPSWYERHPAVPTWNYVAVHVYANTEIVEQEATKQLVRQMVNKYEPELCHAPEILNEETIERMLPAIVGLKCKIVEIQGKQKLGQNKTRGDQWRIYEKLKQGKDHNAAALADYLADYLAGKNR